jgi:preprotein translocase subunit SecF
MANSEKQKFTEIIRPGTKIEFIGNQWWWIGTSIFLLIVTFAMLPINRYVIKSRGAMLNWGVDFSGGTEMTVDFNRDVESGAIRSALDKAGFPNSDVVRINEPDKVEYLLRIGAVTVMSPEREQAARGALVSVGGANVVKFDFPEGGDKFYVRYDKSVESEPVAQALRGVGIETQQVQRYGRPDDHGFEIVLSGLDKAITDGLDRGLGAAVVKAIPSVESVGPKAGAELRNDGIRSLLYAILLIMVYIAWRFDITYGPGTVIALLHDALLTVGAFAITYKEFSLVTVAAVLTIIGFSMNDTIVVFDRIREDAARQRDRKFDRVVNEAINQTLSRTILTSATVFFVTLAMNIWGTGLIRDFAFAMNVGVIVGTYSSIFIASPVLIWLHERIAAQAKKAEKQPRNPRRLRTAASDLEP